MYVVYLRTNLVTGMQYVGQTADIKTRNKAWNSLKLKYGNRVLQADREKYGIDNWTFETLAEVETREEAWALEEKYIKEFNTKYPNGYNFGKGGKRNYEGNKGKKNGMYKKKPWNYGVPQTEEQKEKNRQTHIGLIYPTHRKKVIQIMEDGTKKEWESTSAAEIDGYSQGKISSACNGKNNTIGNHRYKKSEWYFKEDYEKMLGKNP